MLHSSNGGCCLWHEGMYTLNSDCPPADRMPHQKALLYFVYACLWFDFQRPDEDCPKFRADLLSYYLHTFVHLTSSAVLVIQ